MTNEDLFKNLPKDEKKGHPNAYQSERTKMLKMLRNSQTLKVKNGWSRKVGSGFIVADITDMSLVGDNTILFEFGDGHKQALTTGELNLRETDEAIKFLLRIHISNANPCVTIQQINEIGYNGQTAEDVLEDLRRDYPAAHFISMEAKP